jgi:hypothetical protein
MNPKKNMRVLAIKRRFDVGKTRARDRRLLAMQEPKSKQDMLVLTPLIAVK